MNNDRPVPTQDNQTLTVAQMIDQAELPALLPALAELTGDFTLIRDEFLPRTTNASIAAEAQGGIDESAIPAARAAATTALETYIANGRQAAAPATELQLDRLFEFLTASTDTSDFYPMMRRELGLSSAEKAHSGHHEGVGQPDFPVAVIGAGMSGIAAAYRLKKLGVPFVVFERNADVGGVWFENTYPGCRLDTSNFNYSYSFEQKPDWDQEFSEQKEVFNYFSQAADKLGIREHIRFDTEVSSMEFDRSTCQWQVRATGPNGEQTSESYSAVASAVGQLNRPKFPNLPGMDLFSGSSWHTARWDHDTSLVGKRVAVIGTGASAFQVIRAIADEVGSLSVFQRNAPWVVPTPHYESVYPDGQQWLLGNVPTYHRWMRLFKLWNNVEGRIPFAAVDPEWDHPVSVSEKNEELRSFLAGRLTDQYKDSPALAESMIPQYPPYAKRMLRDEGFWAQILQRPDVKLITEPMAEVVPEGIRTEDGLTHEFDVIIYGTGFEASDFLVPMTVTGTNGQDLHDYWGGDAKAHVGTTVPGFPNLFLLYGPNTNLVVHGSIIMFTECVVDYMIAAIEGLFAGAHAAMDCRQEAYDAYNTRVDEANAQMAWGASDVPSWYKNSNGRVSQNWPLSVLEFWSMTRGPDPDHYDYLDAEPS